jgi:hypothetical protein
VDNSNTKDLRQLDCFTKGSSTIILCHTIPKISRWPSTDASISVTRQITGRLIKIVRVVENRTCSGPKRTPLGSQNHGFVVPGKATVEQLLILETASVKRYSISRLLFLFDGQKDYFDD